MPLFNCIHSCNFYHYKQKGRLMVLEVGSTEKLSSFNNWDIKWMVRLKIKHLFIWAVKLFSSLQKLGYAVRQKAKSKLEVILHSATRTHTCTWLVLHRPLARLDVVRKGLVFKLNPNCKSVWLQIQKSNICCMSVVVLCFSYTSMLPLKSSLPRNTLPCCLQQLKQVASS